MSKSKRRTIIYNDNSVHNEIDYEKLAKAIIEANRKKDDEPSDGSDEEIGFWKGVWYIITNKKKTNGTLISGTFSLILSYLFLILAIFIIFILIISLIAIANVFMQVDIWGKIILVVISLMLLVSLPTFALLLKGMSNEIGEEKDRNYVITVFFGIVSLAALVVSLVSLLKGVG